MHPRPAPCCTHTHTGAAVARTHKHSGCHSNSHENPQKYNRVPHSHFIFAVGTPAGSVQSHCAGLSEFAFEPLRADFAPPSAEAVCWAVRVCRQEMTCHARYPWRPHEDISSSSSRATAAARIYERSCSLTGMNAQRLFGRCRTGLVNRDHARTHTHARARARAHTHTHTYTGFTSFGKTAGILRRTDRFLPL